MLGMGLAYPYTFLHISTSMPVFTAACMVALEALGLKSQFTSVAMPCDCAGWEVPLAAAIIAARQLDDLEW